MKERKTQTHTNSTNAVCLEYTVFPTLIGMKPEGRNFTVVTFFRISNVYLSVF